MPETGVAGRGVLSHWECYPLASSLLQDLQQSKEEAGQLRIFREEAGKSNVDHVDAAGAKLCGGRKEAADGRRTASS